MNDYEDTAAAFVRYLLNSPDHSDGGHLGETGREILQQIARLRPRSLFRYRALSEYTTLELFTREIYCGTPSKMNDPLEGAVMATQEVVKRCRDKIKAPPTSAFNKHSLDAFFWRTIDGLRDQYRLCCFSDDPLSPAMWAYYAANHTGVCLEYDVSEQGYEGEIDSYREHVRWIQDFLFPISYSNEPILFDDVFEALTSPDVSADVKMTQSSK